MPIQSYTDWKKNEKNRNTSSGSATTNPYNGRPISDKMTSYQDWSGRKEIINDTPVRSHGRERAKTVGEQYRARNERRRDAYNGLVDLVESYATGATQAYRRGTYNHSEWNKQYNDIMDYIDKYGSSMGGTGVAMLKSRLSNLHDQLGKTQHYRVPEAKPTTIYPNAGRELKMPDARKQYQQGLEAQKQFTPSKNNPLAGNPYAEAISERPARDMGDWLDAYNIRTGKIDLSKLSDGQLNAYKSLYEKNSQKEDSKKKVIAPDQIRADSVNAPGKDDSVGIVNTEALKPYLRDDQIETFKRLGSVTERMDYLHDNGVDYDKIDDIMEKLTQPDYTSPSVKKDPEMSGDNFRNAVNLIDKEMERRKFWKEYSDYFQKDDFKELSEYRNKNADASWFPKYNDDNARNKLSDDDYMGLFYESVNRNPNAYEFLHYREGTNGEKVEYSNIFDKYGRGEEKYMTDDEIAMFNYLFRTDKEAAMDYYKKLSDYELGKRASAAISEEYEQWTKEDPFIANLSTTLTKPFTAVASPVMQLLDLATSGHIKADDPKYAYIGGVNTVRGTTAQMIEDETGSKILSDLYNAGMSTIDNVYGIALGGAIGKTFGITGKAANKMREAVTLGIMSTDAAQTATLENIRNGMSDVDAIINGFAAGGIEFLTEKIGMDNLFNSMWRGKSAWVSFIKQMLSEGSEEVLGNVMNDAWGYVYDRLRGLDISDWRREMNAYIRENDLSPEEEDKAFSAVFTKHLIETGREGLSGMLSGGMLGGGALINAAHNSYNERSFVNEYGLNDPENINRLIDTGLAYPSFDGAISQSRKIHDAAQRMADRIEDGQNVSNRQVRNLASQIAESVDYTPIEAASRAQFVNRIADNYRKSGRNAMAATIEDFYTYGADGSRYVTEMEQVYNAALKGENIPSTHALTQQMIDAAVNAAEADGSRTATQPQTQQAQTGSTAQGTAPVQTPVQTQTEVQTQAPTQKQTQVPSAKTTALQQSIREDTAVRFTPVEKTDSQMDTEYDTLVDNAQHMYNAKAENFAQAYTDLFQANDRVDFRAYTEGANAIYQQAAQGTSLENVTLPVQSEQYINGSMKAALYDAAVEDIQGGANYVAEEKGNISVPGRGERNDSQGAGLQGKGMAEGAGRTAQTGSYSEGGRGFEGRGTAENAAAVTGTESRTSGRLNYHYTGQVATAESLGISHGSSRNQVQIVELDDSPDSREIRELGEQYNKKIVAFAGNNLSISSGIESFSRDNRANSARGAIQGDTMYVRVDHPEFSALQIAKHEAMHAALEGNTNHKITKAFEKLEETFGESFIRDRLIPAYKQLYSKTNLGELQIMEEILCDIAGEMDVFQEAFKNLPENEAAYNRIINKGAQVVQRAVNEANNTVGDTKENNNLPLTKFSFEPYSETQLKDWENSKSIVIYTGEDSLSKFIEDALNKKNLGKKLYFGKISADLAEFIFQSTGIEVKGYNLSLGAYEIIKINKDHGDENKEQLRGQRAVKESDYMVIPDVIENCDEVKLSDTLYFGKPGLEFYKGTGNERHVVIGIVSDKRLDLRIQTMYVNEKRNLATGISEQADINTSETHSGTVSSSEDKVPQNQELGNIDIQNDIAKMSPEEAKSQVSDAQFSLDLPVEETNRLIALHNLNETKLTKALELGGFPMPSIAVTKTDIPHTNFGDITLVMNKQTVDPKAARQNVVYSADAWTPTFPRIEYEANEKATKRASELYYRINEKFGRDIANPAYNLAYDMERSLERNNGVEGLIESYKDDPDMMNLFLADTTGEPIRTIMQKTTTRMSDAQLEGAQKITPIIGDQKLAEAAENDGIGRVRWIKNNADFIEKTVREYLKTFGLNEDAIENVVDGYSLNQMFKDFIQPAIKVYKGLTETTTETADFNGTRKAIREATDTEAYENWLHKLLDDAEKSTGVYNGKDYYTPSGNRRSFSQTHLPVSLENIVKAMRAENGGNTKNISGFHGVKTLRAGMAKRFSSIAEMHKYENRLQNLKEEDFDKIADALQNRTMDIIHTIYEGNKGRVDSNQLIAAENIGNVMMEVTEGNTFTIDQIVKVFDKYHYKISNDTAQAIKELLFDVSQMPVNLFEAKPERAVGFDEVLAAVVPDGTSSELINRLRNAGVQNVMTYEAGNTEDRLAKVNSVEEAKFSQETNQDLDVVFDATMQDAGADLRERVSQLEVDNKKLTQRYEYFKGQTQLSALTKGSAAWQNVKPVISEYQAKKIIRNLINNYGSTIKADDYVADIQYLVTYLATNRGGDHTFDDVNRGILPIAKALIENARQVVDSDGSEILKDIRSTTIRITPKMAQDIQDWNAWRKAHFGRMNVSINSGTDITEFYQMMQDKWGTAFPDILNGSDQLMFLADFVDNFQPVSQNPYSYDMASAVQSAALELYNDMLGADIFKPTFADKSEARIERLKTENQQRIQEVRRTARQQKDNQIQKLKDHYRQVNENRRARRADRDARQDLLKVAKRLDRIKTGKANRALINELIGDLDLVAVSLSSGKAQNLLELNAWYEEQKQNNPDFVAHEGMVQAQLARLTQKHIAEMTLEEVQSLTNALRTLENDIRNENRLIATEDKRSTLEMGMDSIRDLDNARGIPKGKLRTIDNVLVQGTLSPIRFMHRLTGYVDSDPLYQAVAGADGLQGGELKMLDYQMRAGNLFTEWLSDRKFTKWLTGKKAELISYDIVTADGKNKTIQMTPAMRMTLYLASKDRGWLEHMCGSDTPEGHVAGGGIVLPDMNAYSKGNISDAYSGNTTKVKITKSFLNKLANDMTAQEKAFANAIHDYFNGMSKDAINEVSEQLLGRAIAEVGDYLPISVDQNFLGAEYGAIKYDGTIEGMGNLKERQMSKKPVVVRDITDILKQSIESTSKYVGLAIPIRNFNKLMGVTIGHFDENGNYQNFEGSILESITNKWGSKAKGYIEKMISDLQMPSNNQEDLEKAFAKIRSKYAGAVLTLNLSVAMKQAASYPTAAAVLGWRPLMQAFKNPGHVDLDFIAKWTPLQWYRTKGFSTTELGDIQNQNNIFANMPKGLNWIQGVDLLTTRKLWKASEYYVRNNHPELYKQGAGERGQSDAFYRAVANIYNQVITETQPNYTALERPEYLRSKSGVVQTLMMFKTQPMQNFNVLYDAIGNYRGKRAQYRLNAMDPEIQAQYKEAGKKLRLAISSQIGQLVTFAAMTMLWNMFRRKREKYTDEEGNFSLEVMAENMGKDIGSGLFGMLPFGSEVWSFVSSKVFGDTYYGFESVTDSAIGDFGDAISKAWDMISNMISSDEPLDFTEQKKKLRTVVSAASKIFGIPFDNLYNTVSAVYKRGQDVFNDKHLADYYALAWDSDPSGDKKAFVKVLYDAFKDTESDAYDQIRQIMIDSGEFATDSAINKYLEKNPDATREEAVRAASEEYIDKQLETRQKEETANGLTFAEQDEYDSIMEGLPDEYSDYALKLVEAGNAEWQRAKEAVSNGVMSAREYIDFRIKLDEVDQPTESGKLGTYNKDEQVAAIEAMGWTNAQAKKYWEYLPNTSANPYDEDASSKKSTDKSKNSDKSSGSAKKSDYVPYSERKKKKEAEEAARKAAMINETVGVNSSWIGSIGYDEETETLTMTTKNGRTYTRNGVSKEQYMEFKSSDPGRYWNSHFK